MPSRRYIVTKAPIDHINGKMERVAIKCKDTENPEEIIQEGFWYGYRRKISNVNRYGIRKKGRDLLSHPYTAQELENRTLFTISLQVVNANLKEPDKRAKAQNAFLAQIEYRTLIGFCVAMVRANGGEWLPDWE